jgi:hypothetical protein
MELENSMPRIALQNFQDRLHFEMDLLYFVNSNTVVKGGIRVV